MNDETVYLLGRVSVMEWLKKNSPPGIQRAVAETYNDRAELERRLEETTRVVEYLLNGGDPALIEKH